MTRSEILERFRAENPELPARVITTTILNSWLLQGDKDVCAKTRCIVDQGGTTISTSEDDESFVLTDEITNFYDIDEYPGGGVTYNAKRIKKKTMAELDMEAPNWRGRSSGIPKAYYRYGAYIYLDRPIDSEEDDIVVYSVLISDDFDSNVAPYNQLTYLEPFHPALLFYLMWRAKKKIGKREDAKAAYLDYLDYTAWMKSELGGGKFANIYRRPRTNL